ncbi:peroxinectin precursor [Ectocarpus siliculosus]|uniref:Peroxinectin n=1 Tax=Ectocarpus siliculosus TaxID=2880 RepID=D7FX03_ECTSI|nr:peroxinectin precursor [Ectocarpus siliculosus]|eukprot:CBJ26336.1 peroxinectin precursor [Ectocarpus siliculosus]
MGRAAPEARTPQKQQHFGRAAPGGQAPGGGDVDSEGPRFSANLQNATNLGRGVEIIFQNIGRWRISLADLVGRDSRGEYPDGQAEPNSKGTPLQTTQVGQTVLADDLDLEEFTPRSFDGVGNNEAFPSWGAVGATQLRSVAGAYYADADFTPPGDLTRPTAREVMTDVFLESPPALSTMSALFIGWGQLLAFDLSLTSDNSSEPLDIECNDGTGAGGVDVWCPLGAESDPIPFYRSDAALSDDDGALGEETRSPVNYATAFVDLDFVYGRSEDEAAALRSSADGDGFMALTENGLPYVNDDGTWLIADQRSAQFPVTFALHVMLLLEHNRCCMDIAPSEGFEGDEDIYQACRGWTIAVFQHVTENDFLIRLLGGNIQDLDEDGREHPVPGRQSRRGLWLTTDYDENTNPGADTFTLTAGVAAFESALPSTVRVVGEGYESTRYDNIELAAAVGADGLVSFFNNVKVVDVLRGAVLSPVYAADTHYTAAVSNGSPLFKLPVDSVQRGRDHGLPTYNDARAAFGLSEATTFTDVTTSSSSTSSSTTTTSTTSSSGSDADEEVADILSTAYGGNVSTLDAVTGALAEPTMASSGGVFGELLHAAWLEQMYRCVHVCVSFVCVLCIFCRPRYPRLCVCVCILK